MKSSILSCAFIALGVVAGMGIPKSSEGKTMEMNSQKTTSTKSNTFKEGTQVTKTLGGLVVTELTPPEFPDEDPLEPSNNDKPAKPEPSKPKLKPTSMVPKPPSKPVVYPKDEPTRNLPVFDKPPSKPIAYPTDEPYVSLPIFDEPHSVPSRNPNKKPYMPNHTVSRKPSPPIKYPNDEPTRCLPVFDKDLGSFKCPDEEP